MSVSRTILLHFLFLTFVFSFLGEPQLFAGSKTGEIIRIVGNQATISLGRIDGLVEGLAGDVFREEDVGGQMVNLKLADLTVMEVYADSAKIEIRKKLSRIKEDDKIRVDDVQRVAVHAIEGDGGGSSLLSKKWFWAAATTGAAVTTYLLVSGGGDGGEEAANGTISVTIQFP